MFLYDFALDLKTGRQSPSSIERALGRMGDFLIWVPKEGPRAFISRRLRAGFFGGPFRGGLWGFLGATCAGNIPGGGNPPCALGPPLGKRRPLGRKGATKRGGRKKVFFPKGAQGEKILGGGEGAKRRFKGELSKILGGGGERYIPPGRMCC